MGERSTWHRDFGLLREAFAEAASHRSERPEISDTGEPAWVDFEREAMHAEVTRLRSLLGLGPVSIDEVRRVEQSACGHVDYAVKYALGCADLVHDRHPAPTHVQDPARAGREEPHA